jgi:hypothetical protein
MGMRRAITLSGGVFVLFCILVVLLAAPAGAQDGGIPVGAPASGIDTDDNNSPPDVVLVSADACKVTPGASITLEDGDGTKARFVDGEKEITITTQEGHPRIEGPVDDFVGDHATFPDSDTSFDTDGDYTAVGSTGITCGGADDVRDDGTTPAADQYASKKVPPGNIKKPTGVKPGTIAGKNVPNTGGPPYIALAAVALLSVAVIAGRRVLRP